MKRGGIWGLFQLIASFDRQVINSQVLDANGVGVIWGSNMGLLYDLCQLIIGLAHIRGMYRGPHLSMGGMAENLWLSLF